MVIERFTPEQIRALRERRARVNALKKSRGQEYERSKSIRIGLVSPRNIEKELAEAKETERRERNAALRSVGGRGGRTEREQLADEMRLQKIKIKEEERQKKLRDQRATEERVKRAKLNLLRLAGK